MKRPTPASLKKVTPENLVRLGAERLAAILSDAAETKPELKRRLRMELAAEQGPEQLIPEIDRRLSSLETSRSKVSWRQRPTVIRDIDALRSLIVDRLAALHPSAALDRLWRLMGVSRRLNMRIHDKHGNLAAVFQRAAGDLGRLLGPDEAEAAGKALAEALANDPHGWSGWLANALEHSAPTVAGAALRHLADRHGASASWLPLIRLLADSAGDVDAFASTFTPAALKDPSVAAEVGRRLLASGRVADAGVLLEGARPRPPPSGARGRAASVDIDFDWESVWIEHLELSGKADAAQVQRWASFERTLSAERARAFTERLPDFDDVEAEQRAFDYAAAHADFERGLRFLMDWPALREAARMIEVRASDVDVAPQLAEAWAAQLGARYPLAAHQLLRKAAAAAFRRRDFKNCDRLTEIADSISLCEVDG
jgi:hypothetical protein